MPSSSDWEFPKSAQPKPEDYAYDLERALSAVVGLHSIIPSDGFTAETLGTERAGNGIFIRDDHWDSRRLVVHQLAHTMQYERLGSIESFLRQYLHECITTGYLAAPMEQEAKRIERETCA